MLRFSSFKDLYNALPADKFGYSADEEANPDDMLAYYSLEEQIKYGVVGIEIIVCENQGNINLYFKQKALLDTFLEHHAKGIFMQAVSLVFSPSNHKK